MKCKEDILGRESPCSKQDCRNWIKYKEDLNCCLVSVDKHGQMTLIKRQPSKTVILSKTIQSQTHTFSHHHTGFT